MIPDRFIAFYTQFFNWITKFRQGYVFDMENIYRQGNMQKYYTRGHYELVLAMRKYIGPWECHDLERTFQGTKFFSFILFKYNN